MESKKTTKKGRFFSPPFPLSLPLWSWHPLTPPFSLFVDSRANCQGLNAFHTKQDGDWLPVVTTKKELSAWEKNGEGTKDEGII